MGMTQLDRMILDEAREVTGNPKLRNKDIVEWVVGSIKNVSPHEGEKAYFLPKLNVSICVKEA